LGPRSLSIGVRLGVGPHSIHARLHVLLRQGPGLVLGGRLLELSDGGNSLVAPVVEQEEELLQRGASALKPVRNKLDGQDARGELGEKQLGAPDEVALVALDVDLGGHEGLHRWIVLEYLVASGERHLVLLE